MTAKEIEKLEETARTQLHYEAEQTNRRMTWLGTFQGLLFATLGLLLKDNPNPKIATLICILGAVIAALILIEIYGGVISIRRLRKKCKEHGINPKSRPDIFGYYPDQYSWTVFTAPEPLICFFIMTAWVVIFFVM